MIDPERELPPRLWMRLDQLTPEVSKDILDIYYRTAFREDYTSDYLEQEAEDFARTVPEDLRKQGSTELRIGSRVTAHSKLQVILDLREGELIRFRFDSNLGPNPLAIKVAQGDEIGALFDSLVRQYLDHAGLGTVPGT